MSDILKTAHIHLEQAMLRVHVKDTSVFKLELMEEDKPDYVVWISRSNDKTENKTSLVVCVTDGYDLEEIAEWINKYDNLNPNPHA